MTPEEQAVAAYWKAKNAPIADESSHYFGSDAYTRFAKDAMRFVNDAIQKESAKLRENAKKWMEVADREASAALRLRKALEDIRDKVHAHNRGGDLYAGLRDVVRDICDATLSDKGKGA